ncbi:hypothetical protein FSARC_5748 [Fusarium sarcochroum]|uniref:Uncharacterized protein n=1 Tax=Fusarium sarcochroum TaxID=1208366 RepID=A0A8H4TYZ2_9HYPO|nr:hypothetical protein FSARC_5748 [Fusarium sarcochroum]
MSSQSEQASSLEAIKKQEIPGMNTAVYAASMDHCKLLDEFGRKNYILGVEAGASHAQKESDAQIASSVQQSEDVIAALTARNDELERQANQVSLNIALVIHARDRLDSARNQLIEIASAQGVPSSASAKIRHLASKLETVRDECTNAMDSDDQPIELPTPKRRKEPQGRRDGPVKRERRDAD